MMRLLPLSAVIVFFLATLSSGNVPPPLLASPATAQMAAPSGKTQAEKDAETRLERAGYEQITDLRTTKAGITAKAMKGANEVSLLVDSFGKIKELSTGR